MKAKRMAKSELRAGHVQWQSYASLFASAGCVVRRAVQIPAGPVNQAGPDWDLLLLSCQGAVLNRVFVLQITGTQLTGTQAHSNTHKHLVFDFTEVVWHTT